MKQRRLALGDIHGRIEALKQVFELSSFDFENDRLIILGDIADGGYNTHECIDELLKVKNKILLMGNHDEWFMNHIRSGWAKEIWIQQGGANTLRSYGAEVVEAKKITNQSKINTSNLRIPQEHIDFLNTARYYHVEDKMLFVHGGIRLINKKAIVPLERQKRHDLLWDRNLYMFAEKYPVPGFDKVFIGHSTTQNFGNYWKVEDCMKPLKLNNLWMLDTGAGYTGRLTIMDIDTEEYWQSDIQEPAA